MTNEQTDKKDTRTDKEKEQDELREQHHTKEDLKLIKELRAFKRKMKDEGY